MFLYELLTPPYYIYDLITIAFIAVITGLVSFFLARDYVREKRKKFFGPTGKLVASIIVGVVSLVFATSMIVLWISFLFLA